eukprot:Selendium_serpulae@DN6439_c2_g1_i21.p1
MRRFASRPFMGLGTIRYAMPSTTTRLAPLEKKTQHHRFASSAADPFDGEAVVKSFASVDPATLSGANPHSIKQLVGGKWIGSQKEYDVVDPLNGEAFIKAPFTQASELDPFLECIKRVPKTGTHNPFKNPERYLMYGRVCHKAAAMLHLPAVIDFFAKLIQRTMPKSYTQAYGEVVVVRSFLENYSGDRPRMMARGFAQAGDHTGQMSGGYRWPYGSVAIISPFNFPLEIPFLQCIGGLMVGNRVTLKPEATQGLPVEQFIRFLHYCGLPANELDFISCRGDVMSELVKRADPHIRMLQFTGGQAAADHLVRLCMGRVKIEDAGYDWKLMGEDVPSDEQTMNYVAWQCDQDAYSIGGWHSVEINRRARAAFVDLLTEPRGKACNAFMSKVFGAVHVALAFELDQSRIHRQN